MSFVVEDGTGKTNANSYVSTAYALDYFADRGNTSWSQMTQEKQETALIKATDYINSAFKWNGKKMTQEQALEFPRTKLVDANGYKVEGVPVSLQQAVCECADLVANGTEMYQTHEANGAVVSENIGGQLAFTYDISKAVKDSSLYDAINLRLRGLYIDRSDSGIKIGSVKR